MYSKEPPFHYLSIIAIVALDITWGFFEGFTVFVSPIFVLVLALLLGLIGGAATYYIQVNMAKDEQPHAMVKGIVLGIVAGVPFMVTGTVLGLAMLVWLGAASVMKQPEAPEAAEKRKRDAVDLEDNPEQVMM
jgi:uncharacterized membrane protein HdeD (DUF308 family)